jgi:hypothetical protein
MKLDVASGFSRKAAPALNFRPGVTTIRVRHPSNGKRQPCGLPTGGARKATLDR